MIRNINTQIRKPQLDGNKKGYFILCVLLLLLSPNTGLFITLTHRVERVMHEKVQTADVSREVGWIIG